ncbi:hypothetical protein [uncultured Friedmanniella sp.]|uniref:hypothetical protein n=1 Tax=uncultured Friedmanniella sp. TaxID=335381 RepID=UPI0035C9562A
MKIVKIRTVLVAGLAGGVGYVLGTRAGRTRFDELKVQADKLRAQAEKLASSPKVQETVGNVAGLVKENAAKLPDPVADVVTKAADSVTEAAASVGAEDSEPTGTGDGDPLSGVTVEDAGAVEPDSEHNPGV